MSTARLRILFLVDAVYSVGTGLLLLSGTWDDVWDTLELPQGRPALFVQLGGAVLLGVAYLLSLAATTRALMLPLARASAIMNGLSVGVIVAWLIHGIDLDTLGELELIATAALMSVFTVLYLIAGVRRGGYGPEPPPAPDAP